MFNWDNILTNKTESDRLKDFLKKNFHKDSSGENNDDDDLNWITEEPDLQFEKIDIKTIGITHGTNSLSIQLDNDDIAKATKATVKIGDKDIYDFIVEKAKDDKRNINIYSYQFDIYLFNWDNVLTNKTESDRLKEFLKKNFHKDSSGENNDDDDLNWITEEPDLQFEKIDIKTIGITHGTNSLSIQLDNDDIAKATKATVKIGDKNIYDFIVKKVNDNNSNKNVFIRTLKVGDILIFEEKIISPDSNSKELYADPLKRHAVRLIQVTSNIDELNNTPVIEISWSPEDALPFPFCLGEVAFTSNNSKEQKLVSVARGNVVLVDHGYTVVPDEFLGCVPEKGKFRPHLSKKPLTHKGPFDPTLPASSAFNYNVREVYPDITLKEQYESRCVEEKEKNKKIMMINEDAKDVKKWYPRRDLLSSDEFAYEFVVEMENDGTAYIRFGDPKTKSGRTPNNKSTAIFATYRVGNGRKGNVGAETITRIKLNEPDGIKSVRNPMQASGGMEPQDLEEVRQYAPEAFRIQERAVTERDYTEALKRDPEIQKAYGRDPMDWKLVYGVYCN